MYKNKLSIYDKQNFCYEFAKIADTYSGKNNYAWFIRQLESERNEENDKLNAYIKAKIYHFNGIINNYEDRNSLSSEEEKEYELRTFEENIAVQELDKLLHNIVSNHPLAKLVYHLSMLKIFNSAAHSIEAFQINYNDIMKRGLFIYSSNTLPIANLDLKSEENQKIISDIDSFHSKYPSLLEKYDEKALYNTIEHLTKASKDFFNVLLFDFKQSFDDLYLTCSIEDLYLEFVEFDKDFFEEHFNSGYDMENLLDVSNTRYTCGSPETGYNEYPATVLVLNFNRFIDTKREFLYK